MELEIKHVLPYIDGGLYFHEEKYNKTYKLIGCIGDKLWFNDKDGESFDIDIDELDLKPLLRPLSEAYDYFYKLFCETGKIDDFVTFDTLNDFGIDGLEEIDNVKVDYLPHGTFQVLVKHRFDLFDLIPNGLSEPIKENN